MVAPKNSPTQDLRMQKDPLLHPCSDMSSNCLESDQDIESLIYALPGRGLAGLQRGSWQPGWQFSAGWTFQIRGNTVQEDLCRSY